MKNKYRYKNIKLYENLDLNVNMCSIGEPYSINYKLLNGLIPFSLVEEGGLLKSNWDMRFYLDGNKWKFVNGVDTYTLEVIGENEYYISELGLQIKSEIDNEYDEMFFSFVLNGKKYIFYEDDANRIDFSLYMIEIDEDTNIFVSETRITYLINRSEERRNGEYEYYEKENLFIARTENKITQLTLKKDGQEDCIIDILYSSNKISAIKARAKSNYLGTFFFYEIIRTDEFLSVLDKKNNLTDKIGISNGRINYIEDYLGLRLNFDVEVDKGIATDSYGDEEIYFFKNNGVLNYIKNDNDLTTMMFDDSNRLISTTLIDLRHISYLGKEVLTSISNKTETSLNEILDNCPFLNSQKKGYFIDPKLEKPLYINASFSKKKNTPFSLLFYVLGNGIQDGFSEVEVSLIFKKNQNEVGISEKYKMSNFGNDSKYYFFNTYCNKDFDSIEININLINGDSNFAFLLYVFEKGNGYTYLYNDLSLNEAIINEKDIKKLYYDKKGVLSQENNNFIVVDLEQITYKDLLGHSKTILKNEKGQIIGFKEKYASKITNEKDIIYDGITDVITSESSNGKTKNYIYDATYKDKIN